jgi:DUF1009 family protein
MRLPVMAAGRLKANGHKVVAAGLTGETDPSVYDLCEASEEFNLGQIGAMGDFFVRHKVDYICLIGGISRRSVTNSYVPDETAIGIMESLDNFQTDSILRAVAGYLESLGPKVVSIAEVLPELLVRPGYLTEKRPGADILPDLKLAFFLAKELGRLDCGQTVVVSDRIAVALEGADGTDATIRRGAALTKKRIAVAKVVKPGQDFRLDLPVIGPETIAVLAECKAGALALDAEGLLMLEPEKCLATAAEADLAIVAWGSEASEK